MMSAEPGRGCDRAELWWAYWPRLGYARGLSLQHRLRKARREGRIQDSLVVAEHPATVTLGRRGELADLPGGAANLALRGIALYKVGRGGQATYHGPGQVVAYAIVDLRLLQLGVRRFVSGLLNAARNALEQFGVEADTEGPMPGLWVRSRKIVAVGLEVQDGISSHGVSVNVAVDPAAFSLIVPCGRAALGVTSVSEVTQQPPTLLQVGTAFAHHFAAELELRPRRLTPGILEQRSGGGDRTPVGGSLST